MLSSFSTLCSTLHQLLKIEMGSKDDIISSAADDAELAESAQALQVSAGSFTHLVEPANSRSLHVQFPSCCRWAIQQEYEGHKAKPKAFVKMQRGVRGQLLLCCVLQYSHSIRTC